MQFWNEPFRIAAYSISGVGRCLPLVQADFRDGKPSVMELLATTDAVL